MGQVLHIFKKDARYLWREICLVLVLAAIFILTNPWWLATLMLAAASYLIARLIHAEAIPGDRQFWITRPYRSRNLLGAKLLFIVVFVNLPILVAQLLVVAASGFPLSSSVPGLLWSQALIVLISSIPMIALAAMTPGTVPFIFSILILATLWFGAYTTIWVSPKVRQPFWPSAVEWIRDTITVMVLAAIVFCILYVQYRRRRTFLSRTIALVGVAFMAFVHWCLPWPPAWSLQSRLSKQSFDRSSVQVSSDSNSIRFSPRHQRTWENVEVYIPIVVRFVPDELEVKIDALVVTFEAPDGRTWTSTVGGAKRRSGGLGVTVIESTTTMDHSFFNRELEKVVTLRGSLYLTLFGNEQDKTIPVRSTPVNALDGVQCYVGAFHQFYCRAAFRWPARLVYAKFGTDLSPLTQSISYSPFPAGLHLDPIEIRWAPSGPSAAREVTIVVKEPLAHLRRDFEVSGVRLTTSVR